MGSLISQRMYMILVISYVNNNKTMRHPRSQGRTPLEAPCLTFKSHHIELIGVDAERDDKENFLLKKIEYVGR